MSSQAHDEHRDCGRKVSARRRSEPLHIRRAVSRGQRAQQQARQVRRQNSVARTWHWDGAGSAIERNSFRRFSSYSHSANGWVWCGCPRQREYRTRMTGGSIVAGEVRIVLSSGVRGP